jgi:hypothetical protein
MRSEIPLQGHEAVVMLRHDWRLDFVLYWLGLTDLQKDEIQNISILLFELRVFCFTSYPRAKKMEGEWLYVCLKKWGLRV